MSRPGPSIAPDVVTAVSVASRAIGELAGTLTGLPDRAVWTGWLRRMATDGDDLDVAMRCALGDVVLLEAVATRPSAARAARFTAVSQAALWAVGAVRSADGAHRRSLAIAERERLGRYAAPALALLAEHCDVTIAFVVEQLGTTPTTAGLLVGRLAALGVVDEITGRRRDRVFRYAPVVAAFARPAVPRAQRPVGENGTVAAVAAGSDASGWEQAVVERLFERSPAQQIIVFGSVARGESTGESDLDLVVVTPVSGRKHDEAVSLLSAVADLPVAVDVIVVTPEEFPTEARLPGIVRVAVREGRSYVRAA